jgi:anti-anti-sigma factor
MEINNRIQQGCVILDIYDEKFEYPKTLILKNHVLRLLQEGHSHLIINLTHINMLDSFGLAVIISVLKLCKMQNGALALYGANAQVTRLLELTHMDRVLEVWESEAQAIYQIENSTKMVKNLK